MELEPHFIIRIQGMDDLVTDHPFPHWVAASLDLAPFVVIRRAERRNGYVPVGIRGRDRGQRFAAWLPVGAEREIITPYSLVLPVNWKKDYSGSFPETIRTLQLITPLLQQTGYRWGPTGSAGFELATGMPALKNSSDLDLVIDLPERIDIPLAKQLMNSLQDLTLVRLDIQMNTSNGGVALAEYIRSDDVLVKTSSGPILRSTHDLWP